MEYRKKKASSVYDPKLRLYLLKLRKIAHAWEVSVTDGRMYDTWHVCRQLFLNTYSELEAVLWNIEGRRRLLYRVQISGYIS